MSNEKLISLDDLNAKRAEAQEGRPVSDMITITGQIHHSPFGEQPVSIPFAFEDRAKGVEQLWNRSIMVGVTAEELDFGWVNDPGWVMIKNTSKEGTLKLRVSSDIEIPPGGVFLAKSGSTPDMVLSADKETKALIIAAQR